MLRGRIAILPLKSDRKLGLRAAPIKGSDSCPIGRELLIKGREEMKRTSWVFWVILCGLPVQAAFSEGMQFKIEMQNYTDAELKFYCKSITGNPQWVFSSGSVTVPPQSALTEMAKISSTSSGKQVEILCHYSGKGVSSVGPSSAQGVVPLLVTEKATNSIAVDPSFKGVLRLVVNPSIYSKLQTKRVLDTHSEFMVSFDDR